VIALAPVWAGFCECLGICVTPDEKWDAQFNLDSKFESNNGWNCVFMAIAALLVGTTVLVTTIILATQAYYEALGITFDR
jgi:hypothetical protein